jgi:hypothetical protein
LNTDETTANLNAFKNASEMDFDLAIQEDASLIMLSGYRLGNSYQKLPAVLQAFLKYPENAIKMRLREIIDRLYITSKSTRKRIIRKISHPKIK